MLRAARTVAHWESMAKLVRGMLTSLPTMFAVVVLTALTSYFYALLVLEYVTESARAHSYHSRGERGDDGRLAPSSAASTKR